MKKKIKESVDSGSTSAGNIASVSTGFNFPIQKRLPISNVFGYSVYEKPESKKKK